MSKIKRTSIIAASFVLAIALILFAFYAIHLQKQIQNRQDIAAELREQYPFAKSGLSSTMSYSVLFPEKDTWLKLGDYVFRAEVSGDWEFISWVSSPTDKANSGLDTEVVFYLLPVKVTEWLDSRDGQELPGDELWIAYSFVDFNFDDAKQFSPGSSFIFDGSPANRISEYKGIPVVGADTLRTFYITDDETVLSFGFEPVTDELSGYSYEEFKGRIKEIAEKSGWHDKE